MKSSQRLHRKEPQSAQSVCKSVDQEYGMAALQRNNRRYSRGCSTQRSTQKKRKRNLSEMVGRESIEAQEQITSDVIKQIIKKKRDTF